MKNRGALVVVVLVVLGVCAAGVWFFTRGADQTEFQPGPQKF